MSTYKSSISPLQRDGFTIDGTGYFACHQESHRVLYAKTSWCRLILIAIAFITPIPGIVLGLIYNVPIMVLLGVTVIVGMSWYYVPRKKTKKFTPIVEESSPEEAA